MDYDRDGDLDLVTASDTCCDDEYLYYVYRRGPDGQFSSRRSIQFEIPENLVSLGMRTKVAIADWDGDGQPDLLLHRNESRGMYLLSGPLAGRSDFELVNRITGSDPLRVLLSRPQVVDWDGDNVLDILVAMKDPDGRAIYLLRGVDDAGGTRLLPPEPLVRPPDDANFCGLEVADWNGDGTSDLIAGLTWTERDGRRRIPRSQLWVYRRSRA